MNILEEIRENAGIVKSKKQPVGSYESMFEELDTFEQEQELNEGIVFFKESRRLKKFAEKIEKRANKAAKKGKVDGIEKGKDLIKAVNAVAIQFEELETAYANPDTARIEKKMLKQKYNALLQKYTGILNIAKKKETAEFMQNIGATALIVALLVGAVFTISHFDFQNANLAGKFDDAKDKLSGAGDKIKDVAAGAKRNIDLRSGKVDPTAKEVFSQIGSKIKGVNPFYKLAQEAAIKETNANLFKAAIGAGVTVGAIATPKIMKNMKKYGEENKVALNTVKVIDQYKALEK